MPKSAKQKMNQTIHNDQPHTGQTTEKKIIIDKTGWEKINIEKHRHAGQHQIIYTFSGTLRIQIGTSDYFVPEKHIAWIPANTEHELCSNNRQVVLIIFYITLEQRDQQRFSNQFAIYNTNAVIAENLRFISSRHAVICRQEQPDLYEFSYAFFKLLPSMNPCSEITLKTQAIPNDERLQPILRYLRKHLHDNPTIEETAALFGFSVRNLSRLLHNSGIRFNQYLNQQRVTRAIELYIDGGKTIQQIAYEAGFSTPSHFNRVFKQITGMPPGAFFQSKP